MEGDTEGQDNRIFRIDRVFVLSKRTLSIDPVDPADPVIWSSFICIRGERILAETSESAGFSWVVDGRGSVVELRCEHRATHLSARALYQPRIELVGV